jgi:predicted ArsR family transcriptional regulator
VSLRKSILHILKREPLTILELCERLNVTRNAVNVQIKQLETAGLVRSMQLERAGKVGKPALKYEAAPGSEDITSSGYPLFLAGLLSVLKEKHGAEFLSKTLEETGRQLAREGGLAEAANFDQRLSNAMEAANSIGANTEAVIQDNGVMVRNYSCPLGSVVRKEECVCQALAAFFSEATGRKVTEHCLREDRLFCQYFIENPVPKPK